MLIFGGVPSKMFKMIIFGSQDFVGAWLSEWIYFADPAKPYAIPTMKLLGARNSGEVAIENTANLGKVNPGYHESFSTYVASILKGVVIVVV